MLKRVAGRRLLIQVTSMTSCLALAHTMPALAQDATDTRRYGPVTTTGPGETGIRASGGEAPLDVRFSTVRTSGDNADGVDVDSLGSVRVTGSQVATGGAGSQGLDVASVSGPVTIAVDGVSAAAGGAVRVAGGTGPVDLRLGDATAGNGAGVDVATTGAVTVRATTVAATGGTGVAIAGGAAPVDLGFGAIAAHGDGASGASIAGTGAVSVSGSQVSADGAGADGVSVSTDGASLVRVDGIATGGDGGAALRVRGGASGTGDTDVRVGTIRATGGAGVDVATGGTVAVAATTVATAGTGVMIAGGAAPVTFGFGSVTTSGDDATGVAVAGDGPVAVTGSQVATGGAGSQGLDVASVSGPVTIAVDGVSAAAGGAVRVAGGTGPVDLRLGDATAGNGAGVDVATTGAVTVRATTVAATGGTGVAIAGGAAPVDLGFGAIAAHGDGASGASIAGTGAVSVSGSQVSADGAGADGVSVSTDGASLVRVDGIATGGDGGAALRVRGGASGTGDTDVRVGTIRATGGAGVDVATGGTVAVAATTVATAGTGVMIAGGAAPVTFGFGSVTTSGDDATGVAVAGDGPVAVTGSQVATGGAGSQGLDVASVSGPVTIAVDGVSAAAGGAVRVAGGTGPVDLRLGDATAGNGAGVDVATTGAVTVRATTVAATGGTGVAIAGGAAPVDLGFGAIAAHGDGASGASIAGTGAVSVSGSQVSADGAGADGVSVSTDGASLVRVDGIATGGDGGAALRVRGGASGTGDTDVRVGTIRATGGAGVDVATGGTVAVAATTVATAGTGVMIAGGAAPVTFGFGSVTTSGDDATGVAVAGDGPVAVTGSQVATGGAGSTGLMVGVGNGPANIRIDAVNTVGDGAEAIRVTGGSGTTTIRVADVAAASATAIDVDTKGAIDIQPTDIVSSGAGAAIRAMTTDALFLRTGKLLSGTDTAIDVAAGLGSTIAISGQLVSQSGLVLRVGGNGSAITVEPDIVLNGRFQLSGGADTLTNQGVFQVATGSGFGTGNDRLVNTGLIDLPGSAVPVSATVLGLEATTNAGLINLANGVTGDTLHLSGDFEGVGNSTLRLDPGANGVVDKLIIDGRATGSTVLDIVGFNAGDGRVHEIMSVVQAGSGSDPDAFRLPGGPSNGTFVDTLVALDPGTSTYAVLSTPTRGLVDLSQLSFSARQSFHRTVADIAAAGRSSAGPARTGLWGQFAGSDDRFDRTVSATLAGGVRQTGLRLDERVLGGQIGYTVGLAGRDAFGIVAGYTDVTGHQAQGTSRYTVHSADIGVSGHLQAGIAYADLLALYDRHWIDYRSAAPFNLHPKGDSYGGQAELGARVPLGAVRLTLFGAAEYSRTDLGRYAIQDVQVSFDGRDGARGSAGLRIDAGLGGARVFAEGRAVHDFRSEDPLELTLDGFQGQIDGGGVGTYGAGSLGVDLTAGSRTSVSVSASGAVGDDYRSIGGRAAFRLRF